MKDAEIFGGFSMISGGVAESMLSLPSSWWIEVKDDNWRPDRGFSGWKKSSIM